MTESASRPPIRVVTAASLFDGHDAAINIMRRLIQAQGAEVIHLGHNRSVEDIVRAAVQEDADGIAGFKIRKVSIFGNTGGFFSLKLLDDIHGSIFRFKVQPGTITVAFAKRIVLFSNARAASGQFF